MNIKSILLALLLWSLEACAAETLTFDKLAEAPQQQEILIRGFFYRDGSGGWILASEPNLKTCCVGQKLEQQIFVEGDVGQPKPGYVYTVRGVFSIEPLKDSSGKLVQRYHLKNATIR